MLTAPAQSAIALPFGNGPLDPSQWTNLDPTAGTAGLNDALRSALKQPMDVTFWQLITSLNYVQAAIFIAVGLVCLLYGLKVFKILVIVNAAVLGAWAGSLIGTLLAVNFWPIAAGAVLAAVLAWPLLRLAVSLTGGLAGAMLGALLARSFTADGTMIAAGALLGLVVLGILAFVIFRAIIICSTAVQGAVLTVAGLLAIVIKFDKMSPAVNRALTERPYMLAVLVLAPAIIGVVYQITHLRKGNK